MSAERRPSRVFLVGFLASGKTAVGRALAAAWGTGFMDVDALLLAEEGAPSLLAMLEARGEPYFRARERALLEGLTSADAAVVATGSGTPATEENLALLHRLGSVVFLHTPWATILARLGSKEGVLPPGLPPEALHAVYLQRLPFYQRADLVLAPIPGETPDALALRLRMLLKEPVPCAI
jgi:shikimate kinase